MNSFTCPHCFSSTKAYDKPNFCPACGKKYSDAFKVSTADATSSKPKFKITVKTEADNDQTDNDDQEVNPSQFKWTVSTGGTETDSDGKVKLKKYTINDWAQAAEPPARNPGNVQGDVLAQKREWMQSRAPINVGIPQGEIESGI